MTNSQKKRGNPNMVRGAASINPKGRPRIGQSLSEQIRQRVTPDQLITFALDAMENATSYREKLVAMAWLSSHGWGSPTSSVNLTVGRAEDPQLPPMWRTMTSREQDAWIDEMARARLAPGDMVIDILESGQTDDESDDGDESDGDQVTP